jgi:hypothetical protein
MQYITHARNTEELRVEVCSDIRRRIEMLSGQAKTIAKSETEKARLACAIREFEDMYRFWDSLTIMRPRRKPNATANPRVSGGIAAASVEE